jgi:LuxR family maltose regulon positive regulatory protein
VRRPRLEALLDEGARLPLTVLSAPAGTGKTVLASSWAAGLGAGLSVAWVSLRDETIGPSTFWGSVAEGLERCGVRVPAASEAVQPSYTAAVAASVIDHPDPVVLVLDCDGVLTHDVASRLDALMHACAGRLRVVLLGREDPLLPLHRYRLAGTLTELRMADLSFTPGEAMEMLVGMGVDLSDSAMTAMIDRTQGWAAGLRLAAMALAHRTDRDEAALRLAGDQGTVAEYLLAEVLDVQPPGVRRLLLDTSVVDVLRPGLAAALCGPQADRALSFLVHGNAFLEELHEGVGGYRYHDLFRQLLQAQLAYESPERWVDLNLVAASWLAAHGQVTDAVRHALAVQEWELAARYVVDDLAVVAILTGRQSEGMHDALATLPRAADGAAALIVNAARWTAEGDLNSAAAALERAGTKVGADRDGSWPAADLAVAVIEVALARRRGAYDVLLRSGAVAQRLLHIQDPSRLEARPEIEAEISVNVAAALVGHGDLDAAADALATFAGAAELAGREHALIDALGHGAVLAAWRGDLNQAVGLAGRAVRISSATGLTPTACPAAAEVALAYVDTERYDLAAARAHAHRAAHCAPTVRDPLPAGMLALAGARIHRAGGDVQTARRVLEEAADGLPPWLQDEMRAERDRILREPASTAAGTVAPVVAIASAGRDVDTARLVMRDQRGPLAARMAACLDSAAARQRAGRERDAVRDLELALRLAAPEQSRRVFREAPDELWQLLRRHPDLWARHGWLTEGQRHGDRAREPQPHAGPGVAQPEEAQRIYEPLTAKEQEVLGHLSELLTTEEIAAVMFISVNTVRTHVRNILRKLAASRRNEAVRRARDLRLIHG